MPGLARLTPLAGLLAVSAACGQNRAVNEPPVAVIGPDRTARPGEEIQLRGDSSFDRDGMIVRYVWDFGDGTMAEEVMVTKAWTEPAVYAVTLTVEDDRGRRDTAAIRVTVEGSKNEQPTAVVDGPSTGAPDEALTFDGSNSSDPDGTLVEHAWEFGDGGTATGSTATYRYSAEGSYTVTLRVTDDRGAVGQATRSVRISQTSMNQPPVAAAGPDKMADANEQVMFTGRGSVDPDGSIVSYVWDMGDGSMQQGIEVTHSYAMQGMYIVRLTVTDDGGLTSTDTAIVTVAAPPPPTSYDGEWLFNPMPSQVQCMNTRASYSVPFPVARIRLTGTQGATVMGTVVGSNRLMTGSIDRTANPPRISLAWMGNANELGGGFPSVCGTGMAEHRLSADLVGERSMQNGRFTVLLTWSDQFCTCTQPFDFTAGKQ